MQHKIIWALAGAGAGGPFVIRGGREVAATRGCRRDHKNKTRSRGGPTATAHRRDVLLLASLACIPHYYTVAASPVQHRLFVLRLLLDYVLVSRHVVVVNYYFCFVV